MTWIAGCRLQLSNRFKEDLDKISSFLYEYNHEFQIYSKERI